jgi:hypothetical protein
MIRKTYQLIQKKIPYILRDLQTNEGIVALQFKNSYSTTATFEFNNSKYSFSSNTFGSKLFLNQGNKRIVEIEMRMSGDYLIRMQNHDDMTKYFTLSHRSMMNTELVVKDFLTNELFSIKSKMTWVHYEIDISEEAGWADEENNIDKTILLIVAVYSTIIMNISGMA